MAQEGKISITIDKEIWKELAKLKIDMDVRSFDKVIEELMKKYKKIK